MDPKVARAAANLRIAGVSEERIYHSFQGVLKNPPTYRELRSVWARYHVGYRRVRGRRDIYLRYDKTGKLKRVKGRSAYRKRFTAQKTPKQQAKLAKDYALGYLIEQNVDPREYREKAVFQYVTSEYETGY
jgi:hypothetical protein